LKREGKKSGEFRRYRQLLAGVYLVCAAAIGVLLLVSVVKALLFPPPVSAQAAASTADCAAEIDRLARSWEAEATAMVAPPSSPDGERVSRLRDLTRERLALRARCLSQAGTGLRGVALAEGLEALADLEAGIRRLLDQFDRDVAAPREQVRRSLARVRSNALPGRAGGGSR
jgi:hypothetical protein